MQLVGIDDDISLMAFTDGSKLGDVLLCGLIGVDIFTMKLFHLLTILKESSQWLACSTFEDSMMG